VNCIDEFDTKFQLLNEFCSRKRFFRRVFLQDQTLLHSDRFNFIRRKRQYFGLDKGLGQLLRRLSLLCPLKLLGPASAHLYQKDKERLLE